MYFALVLVFGMCFLHPVCLGITLIGIGDTNCDPEELDYIIPGNDDAIRGIRLISSVIADAVLEAKQGEQIKDTEAAAEEAKDAE